MNRIFINIIVDYFYYIFIAFIILNFTMGMKKSINHKKRSAVLYFSIFIFILYIYALILKNKNLNDIYLLVYFVFVIPLYIIFKKHLLPFQLRCINCKRFLSFDRIMYTDYDKCAKCEPEKKDEKKD